MRARPALLVATLAVVGLLPGSVRAQGSPAIAPDTTAVLPDTPAGRRAAEALRIFADGDDATTRAFVEQSFAPEFRDAYPIEDHVRIHAQMRERTGGYDVVDVRRSEPTALVLLVKARKTGELATLRLRTEDGDPWRIAGIGIGPVDPADAIEVPEVPRRHLPDDEIASLLGDYLDRLAAADAFSGVVLVARGGKPVFERAYGEASKSYGVENRVDTKFNLGSMNKMFTAVSIAQLAEKGALSYDDPVGRWLGREWVRPEVGEKVTIRHLLTHTSGLGSYFSDAFMNSSRALYREIDDYQPLVRDDSLAFEPGTRWSYSNTGFLLLGAIVEKASGESYYDYVREHVYAPAGMTNTDAWDVDAVVPNRAQGYERVTTAEGTTYRSNILEHVARGGPAGGGFSTAPDLLSFAEALLANRLTSPATTARITTAKPEAGSPDYGFGFQQWEQGRVFGHTGGFPGISSALMIDRESGDVIAVMSNYGRASAPVTELASRLLAAGR